MVINRKGIIPKAVLSFIKDMASERDSSYLTLVPVFPKSSNFRDYGECIKHSPYDYAIFLYLPAAWFSTSVYLERRGHRENGCDYKSSLSINVKMDEYWVLIFAHEFYHYLHFTKQLRGKDMERGAWRFALKELKLYRDYYQN